MKRMKHTIWEHDQQQDGNDNVLHSVYTCLSSLLFHSSPSPFLSPFSSSQHALSTYQTPTQYQIMFILVLRSFLLVKQDVKLSQMNHLWMWGVQVQKSLRERVQLIEVGIEGWLHRAHLQVDRRRIARHNNGCSLPKSKSIHHHCHHYHHDFVEMISLTVICSNGLTEKSQLMREALI